MPFLVAAAVLFLALLAGTVIEVPRLCSGGRGGIELSQARLVLSPPYCCRGLSSSSVLPWDHSCAAESFTKSAPSTVGFDAFRHPFATRRNGRGPPRAGAAPPYPLPGPLVQQSEGPLQLVCALAPNKSFGGHRKQWPASETFCAGKLPA
jgi:hypothetical protein